MGFCQYGFYRALIGITAEQVKILLWDVGFCQWRFYTALIGVAAEQEKICLGLGYRIFRREFYRDLPRIT